MKKAAIYSRKSKFTGKGDSIENQITLCRDYGKNLGMEEFVIYEDEGFSGKNTDRPQFQAMLKDAKQNKFDVLICYRLDRLSRNVGDFAKLIEELQRYGINFISIREQFDTSSPMGRAMMYIASVFAQLERETIAERIRDNMLELAKSGRWLGGQTPLGYDSTPISFYDNEMNERKMYKLTPNSEELRIVNIIFSQYLEYKSISQVNKFLLSKNIKTKNKRDWNKKSIRSVLTNPVYVKADNNVLDYLESLGITVVGNADNLHGILTYNKKKGKGNLKDITEWIAALSKHEGIIDADKWIQVQHLLEEGRKKAPRFGTSAPALLTGLLRCSNCGSHMRVVYGGINKQTGVRTYYYSCGMKVDSGKTRCESGNVRGDQIEKMVVNRLKELTYNKGKFIEEFESYKKGINLNNKNIDRINDLSNNINENENAIHKLVNNLSQCNDETTRNYIFSEIKRLDTINENYKKELIQIKKDNDNLNMTNKNIDVLIQLLNKFSNLFDKSDIEEKKLLIGGLVNEIYWNGSTGDIDINLFGNNKKK